MNRIFRRVWNSGLQQWVVASELASGHRPLGMASRLSGTSGALSAFRLPLAALCLALSSAPVVAQEFTVTDGSTSAVVGDGGTITFIGDDNVSVTQTGTDDDARLVIALQPDLEVESLTAGTTRLDGSGVAVGANVVLGSNGLVLSGGPSVTMAGINAGNNVITGVSSGTANDHAVNFGQLSTVSTAASGAQSTADAAALAAAAAQTAANAAGAAWNLTDGSSAAGIGPGGTVTFQGDGNISVALTGADDNGVVTVTLDPELTVTSITAGNTAIDTNGLTISGGPSVTSSGISAGGMRITDVADGDLSAGSTDAVTGRQIFDLFIEEGAGGVRYFRAKSAQPDSQALGDESIAIGPNTIAAGDNSFAAGDGAVTTATAAGAVALGQGATAGTDGGLVADGAGSIAIGRSSLAAGNSTLAVGDGASVASEDIANATAVGAGARVTGNFSTGATAVGANAQASAGNATALGSDAQAAGSGSVAVGQAHADAGSALAAGSGAYAGTTRGIALGSGAGVGTFGNEGGDRTDHIAIGTNSGQGVVGNQTTAIGYGAGQGVTGDDNLALGTEAGRGLAGNNNISIGLRANDGAGTRAQSIAIGDGTRAGSDSVALGSGARADGSETLALGKGSYAGGNGVAVGAHATAQGSNIALGRNSAARDSDVAGAGYLTGAAASGTAVSVGNSNPGESFQRRIVNVADGAQGYDAVNVRQLQGAQQAVANLVGGEVTVQPNGSFGGYVIELSDTTGATHRYTTVAAAINAVTSGAISVLPGDAVIYNPDGTLTVAAGVLGDQAVNVEQLNAAIAENGVKYYSANTTIDANRDNDGATGTDAMAIGPGAVASGTSSLAIGHAARVNEGAHNGVAIGHDVSARAENATVLGNRSHAYDEGGVAIGQEAVSRGQNSIVMGTGAEADPKSGDTVNNAIVIGTVAEATADDGIAIGQSALASEVRAVAQGYDAHALAADSQASGTRARTTGVNAQASGTDAHASGDNAIAAGTNARGYAADGIAMGTGAVSGFEVTVPGDAVRNRGSIAIGDSALSDDRNALALGVQASANAESATAIGDDARATAQDALAVGSSARASAENASAFGRDARATAAEALAVGSGAQASAQDASAFGRGAQASHAGSVALGSDAVTATAVGTASIMVDRNTYSFAGTSPVATVSVGAPDAERTITNVAAGRISAVSTDAINGSQLYGTNMALEALADDLDTAGGSIADVLGGNAEYDPVTHQVTMSDVGGTGQDTVHEAIEYAAQGWDVSANGGTEANVAPGGSVDFSNVDGNIVIERNGTDLTFDLAENIDLGPDGSVTIGDTLIDGDSIVTTNLTVGGTTQLGDHFTVNDGGVYYDGPITEGDHIVNKTYVDGAVDDLANTPLTFAGDAGTNVDRLLGETVSLVGGATDEAALTDGNIGVVANGSDTLEIKLNKDIDLGADGSLAIGDGTDGSTLDAGGLAVVDGDQTTTVGAGTISVTDGADETTIGGNAISVGGNNPIVIDGNAGTIGGLTNTTFDPDATYTGGVAATQEQLSQVNGELIAAGLDFVGDDGQVVHRDLGEQLSITGGASGALSEGNIGVTQNAAGDGLVVELADNIALTEDGSLVIGDGTDGSTLDAGGLAVVDGDQTTTVGAGTISVTDGADETTIGGNAISVGGNNPIVIDGNAGVIGGLTNTTFDPDNFTSGQAATEDQLAQVGNDLTGAGLNFVGNDGEVVHRDLGETLSIEGGASGNIGVTRNDDEDGLVVELADNIALTEDGSLTIGDGTDGSTLDAGGLAVVDGDQTTTVGAGTISVTDGADETTIGGNAISVGGNNPIVIDGNAGTIGGLQNQTIAYPEFADGSGRAATEEQLAQVNETANAGWNVTDAEGNTVNIGPNGEVLFTGDQNLTVAQTGEDDAGVVAITLNRDLDLDSVTVGDTVIDGTGVAIGADVKLGDTGLTIVGGPSVTVDGIDAGNQVITGVAAGVAGTDAVNVSQLEATAEATRTKYYSVNSTGGGNFDNDGATGADAIAAGKDAEAEGDEAVAMGLAASASGDGSLALGAGAQAQALNALAIGAGAVSSHANSIALGAGSATTVGAQTGYQGAFVGSSDSTGELNIGGRQVTGVAAGSADTDAVNVSQLQGGVNHAITEANQYTDGQISNVNNRIDVIDGRVTAIEGDIIDIRGDITDIQGDIVDIRGDITDLDGRVTNIEGVVVEVDNRISSLENGGSGPFQVTQGETFVAPTPSGQNASAGGNGAVASGDNSVAVGNQSTASGAGSTAVGQGATASATDSTALGQGATASHGNSVALGAGSATTVGAQTDYNAAYVGTSTSTGEVNVGGRTLTGVAPGIAGTDAVNVNQLGAGINHAINSANQYTDGRIAQIQDDMWTIERGYRGATASAMAMAGLPQAYLPGKSMLAVGVGGYQSEYGMAVGLSGITENGRYVYRAQASGNTARDWGFSVGAGIQW